MRVLYDVSVLGMSALDSRARTGVFRTVESLAAGLASSPECELSFCAGGESLYPVYGALKYLEALPTLAQGKNATIFLPAEAAGVMGAIGGLRELVMRAASSSLHTQSDAPARLGPRSDADSGPKDPR